MCDLVKRLFTFRIRTPSEKVCLRILQTRALFFHAIWTGLRIAKWGLGSSYWLEEIPEKCDDIGSEKIMTNSDGKLECLQYNYNEKLVSDIRPSLEIIIMVMIVLSALLDIATYKWRYLAHSFLYLEVIFGLVSAMIPQTYYNSIDSFQINIVYHLAFITLYTDHAGQIIFMTVISCILRFLITSGIYQVALTFETMFNDSIYILFLFLVNSLMAILILYIT